MMTNLQNKTVLFIALSTLLYACAPYTKNRDTTLIDNVQARTLVKNKKENIYILYGGDYWFHALK